MVKSYENGIVLFRKSQFWLKLVWTSALKFRNSVNISKFRNSFSATRGSSPRKIGRSSCKFHVWFLLHSQTRCNAVCSYQAKVAIDLCASPISVNPTIVPLGCSYVERYLDRISNGTIPDDRRSAMTELQSLVAESRSAQMSFGAMGISFLPVSWYLFSSCSGETGAYLHLCPF